MRLIGRNPSQAPYNGMLGKLAYQDRLPQEYLPVQKWFYNIVVNGIFGTDSDWTKGTGWTISGGTASSDGTQVADSDLTQTLSVTIGKTYSISFDVANYSAGNVALVFDGTEVIADKAANGTYTTTVEASNASVDIDLRADLNFIGDVDNISVREAYELPSNISNLKVYDTGVLLREGEEYRDGYTVADDGFKKTITFDTAPGINDDVLMEYY